MLASSGKKRLPLPPVKTARSTRDFVGDRTSSRFPTTKAEYSRHNLLCWVGGGLLETTDTINFG